MKAPCPGCKTMLDYEEVPAYSAAKQTSGKFCPHCNHPLDRKTAMGESLDYGPSSKEIQEVRAAAADKFVSACKNDPTPEATPA